MQRVLQDFKRDNEAVTAAAWHPKHEEVFASGSQDGSVTHWLVSQPTTQVLACLLPSLLNVLLLGSMMDLPRVIVVPPRLAQ